MEFSGTSADKPNADEVTWQTRATRDGDAADIRLAQSAGTDPEIDTPPSSESTAPAAAEPMADLPQHPSDPLIAGSQLVRERWSDPDAVGNRERVAIYQTEIFKYPWLRVVESWSGKTGTMESRLVMVADHLLVEPRPGVDPADFDNRIREVGFKPRDAVGENGMLLSFGTRIDEPDELPLRIAALEGLVEFAEPDYLVWPSLEPNDPDYTGNKLWGLLNRGGVSGYKAGSDIDAPAAWDIRTDASNVVVSVTDTGIRYTHQDLAPNMWRNPGEIPGDGIDNDGNGVVDDVLTGFSCFGRNSVDIAAPGWQIWSSYRGGDADYRFLQGTSMAAPHVSGALALALAHFPGEGVDRLIGRLYSSADRLPSLNGKVSTGGRLNLHGLLAGVVTQPYNDMFDQPFTLEGNFATWRGHNRDATREPDEGRFSLAGENRTLWFAWQAPYDGFATLTASSAYMGQRVVIYSGESRNALSVVYDSPQNPGGEADRLPLPGEGGTTLPYRHGEQQPVGRTFHPATV